MPWLTLNGSNYPCLEQISMVPKMFEPLKFDCILSVCLILLQTKPAQTFVSRSSLVFGGKVIASSEARPRIGAFFRSQFSPLLVPLSLWGFDKTYLIDRAVKPQLSRTWELSNRKHVQVLVPQTSQSCCGPVSIPLSLSISLFTKRIGVPLITHNTHVRKLHKKIINIKYFASLP